MEPGKWDFLFKILFQINFIWLQTDVIGELFWLVEGIQMGKSFVELSFIAPCAAISVLSSVKALFFYIHQEVVIDVVEKLKRIHPVIDHKQMTDDKTTEDEELNDVIRRNVKDATKFLNSLIGIDLVTCLTVVVAFCLLPISAMGYEYWQTGTCEVSFPFNVKFFFDPYSNSVWPFVYVHQVWSTFVAFFNTVGTDTFFFAFCVYMRMHFHILQRRFQDAVREREGRQFVAVVQRHQELIYLADQVEILYSQSTLFNIVTSSVLICLSGFNVTSVQDTGVIISFLAFLTMSLMQIFLMCYFGDMLARSSTETSNAVYNSVWYQTDQSMKKNVLFVLTKMSVSSFEELLWKLSPRLKRQHVCRKPVGPLEMLGLTIRSRRPCKLTAARFADVNLTTFTTILSRSWSLFALLKTVYK